MASDNTKVQVVPRYSDTGTRTGSSCYTRDEKQNILSFFALIFQHVQAADIVVLISRSIYGKVWRPHCHHPATSIVRVGTTSPESHRSILYPNLMQRNPQATPQA
ncbi:hypothetical protein T4D_6926 [Trichinella pseudospiralis]|uniref:Uncharacterized protein n=1 Tax=Trichinella pseudospiralis TaxID=6337 RepID=A0A0V1F785_TRIPS|nr:hypothetical protein T4D_6926 [Trichinella pseudospiralis]